MKIEKNETYDIIGLTYTEMNYLYWFIHEANRNNATNMHFDIIEFTKKLDEAFKPKR